MDTGLLLVLKGCELPQEEVLEQQQLEREDHSFQHGCMFCSQEFTGNRCCTATAAATAAWLVVPRRHTREAAGRGRHQAV